MRKEIGCIQSARFGFGGYQDACIGLSLTFGTEGWGVSTFVGGWAIERSEHARWTEGERRESWADAVAKLSETLKAAKKEHVEQLVGVPVEVTLDGNLLKDWRVLKEAIR